MFKFTIITVVYNGEKTIRDSLLSLRTQKFKNFEFILVDGASSDLTVKIVKDETKNWDVPVKILSEPDKGIYDAMNKAIPLARGEWLYFLNADDTLYDDNVLYKINGVLDSSSPDICYGNLNYINPDTNEEQKYTPSESLPNYLKRGCVTQQAIFYRKSVFQKVGKFKEKITIVGDYEWLLRAVIKRKISYQYINEVIANFYLGGVCNNPRYKKQHDKQRLRIRRYYMPLDTLKSNIHFALKKIRGKR